MPLAALLSLAHSLSPSMALGWGPCPCTLTPISVTSFQVGAGLSSPPPPDFLQLGEAKVRGWLKVSPWHQHFLQGTKDIGKSHRLG